jgi:LCP family protein required for cell wall assembly
MKQRVINGIEFNRKVVARERRKQQRKRFRRRCVRLVLIVVVALTSFEVYKFLTVLNAFEQNELNTLTTPEHTLGILVLGLDKDGGKNTDAGHTDSITYIAANTQTKQAYALPIYRDTNIPLTCDDSSENINRVYAQRGVKCLAESTSAFLNLPVNNYVVITMVGFVNIIDALGSVSMIPEESFCSHYGMSEKVTYCFTADEPTRMSGDEAIAYVRYRGGGNGERRANRQVAMIKAVKDQCLSDMFGCYNKVSGHLPNVMKTNFGVNEIPSMLQLFGRDFTLETLDVIRGRNVELSAGNWTEYANEEDKEEKTAIIREEIFNGL